MVQNELIPPLWAIPGNLVFPTPIGYSHSICGSLLVLEFTDGFQLQQRQPPVLPSWCFITPGRQGFMSSPGGPQAQAEVCTP